MSFAPTTPRRGRESVSGTFRTPTCTPTSRGRSSSVGSVGRSSVSRRSYSNASVDAKRKATPLHTPKRRTEKFEDKAAAERARDQAKKSYIARKTTVGRGVTPRQPPPAQQLPAPTKDVVETVATPDKTTPAPTGSARFQQMRLKRKLRHLNEEPEPCLEDSPPAASGRKSLQVRRDELKQKKASGNVNDLAARYDDLLMHTKRPRFSVSATKTCDDDDL
eukprot:TRINITY_DN9098_c0_g1_i1.p1 TRINITY_DN9098_c0_g1~~TRINITY_DN9098_c0_g1_i1.p1  ORF type:complete len:220 (+),score=46.60 TRINITY_DN9098_c0_g1_i1:203-862(+)